MQEFRAAEKQDILFGRILHQDQLDFPEMLPKDNVKGIIMRG
jgi:hypothetical protein